MKLNKVFQTAEVPIPDRSGFDLGREHLFTAPVGTLVPAECFEVLPNDTISMGAMKKVTLPPFAVPFMGRIDACLEAFFVPSRILWSGWQAFITQNSGLQISSPPNSQPIQVPTIDCSSAPNASMFGNGTLADYLGYSGAVNSASPNISAMKFLCYHMIADHWYRDQNNVKPFFVKSPYVYSNFGMEHVINSFVNSTSASVNAAPVLTLVASNQSTSVCDTSIGLGSLRQRSWAKDYFTTMTTRPQAGDDASITFATSGATGTITVADIRSANALQKWLERNNLSGTDYGSQILAHFGVTPPDAVLNKPVLLGQMRESVYINSVTNNGTFVEQTQDFNYDSNNPFAGTLGAAAGFGSAFGKGSLIPEFHAKEHGYIMVMFSLVPHAYYDTGLDRDLLHKTVGDYAWPEYARIGDQPVYDQELWIGDTSPGDVIGYNQRYSEYKSRIDKISGLLHDNASLDVYALKRGFTSQPSLGKAFLEIPTNYLDQVSSANYNVSSFGCIVDCFFDTKAIRLLPEYSLPSL